jgi:hypothetical protein
MKIALVTIACTTILASTAACASIPSEFNPDSLGGAQFSRVDTICQTVMGLSPKERLTGGDWRGEGERLDYMTSHYRGCVTSLSDSALDISGSQASTQADADCRSRGYANGSPDLALCVLENKDRLRSAPGPDSIAANNTVALPVASGSFFYARPGETHRREEIACAALGLEPSGNGFGACVKSLDDIFFAIDNPIT